MSRDDADWHDEQVPYVAFEKTGEHVARKRHTCTNCHHDIERGETYFRHTALVEGDLVDDKWHRPGHCKPHSPTDEGLNRGTREELEIST